MEIILILKFLLIYTLITPTISASLSIDFGSEFITTSIVASRKPITLMENPQSKTKTNQYLYMSKQERIFGYDAKTKLAKESSKVFHHLSEFIGKISNSTEIKKYLKEYYQSYNIEEDIKTKRIIFPLNYANTNNKLSTEEIFAIMLRFIKQYSEKYSKSEISDFIMSVPCFFDYKQRQAIINAAELSGMKLTRLIHDNSAAAVKYFNDKKYTKKKQYYIFYNMGASYTQVSLISIYSTFTGSKSNLIEEQHISIIDESYDRYLGGKNFDIILAKIIITKYYNEVKKINITNKENDYINNDMIQRVLPYAIKYKEILSANKEIDIKVNGIEKGSIEFESHLTRKEFEEASINELSRVYKPIDTILKRVNMTIDNIEQVELIGGCIRIPSIKKKLMEYINSEKLGIHLNGDDVIALGSGIYNSELLGYISKVNGIRKKIYFENNGHIFSLKIKILSADLKQNEVYCNDNELGDKLAYNCIRKINKETTIFKRLNKFNSERSVSFKHDSNFIVKIIQSYENNDEANTTEYQNKELITYNINFIKDKILKELKQDNPTLIESKNDIRIKLIFSYDKLGQITMKIEILYKIKTYLTLQIQKSKNNKIEFKYLPKVPKPLSQDDIKKYIDEVNSSKDYSPDDKKKVIKTLEKGDVNSKYKIEESKKYIYIKKDYIIYSQPIPYTKNEIKERKIILKNFDEYEKKNFKYLELQNNLESFIFNKNEWIKDIKETKKYSKESELNSFKTTLTNINNWYDSNKENISFEILKNKYNELKNSFKPINDRIIKNNKRKNSIKYFRSEVRSVLKQARNWIKEKPWLEKYFNEELQPFTQNYFKWIDDMEAKQNDIPEYEPEIINKKIIEDKLYELYKKSRDMKKIKKSDIKSDL